MEHKDDLQYDRINGWSTCCEFNTCVFEEVRKDRSSMEHLWDKLEEIDTVSIEHKYCNEHCKDSMYMVYHSGFSSPNTYVIIV
jgi:hypothetical protein